MSDHVLFIELRSPDCSDWSLKSQPDRVGSGHGHAEAAPVLWDGHFCWATPPKVTQFDFWAAACLETPSMGVQLLSLIGLGRHGDARTMQ
ncbi:MAG: hypothetical protein ACRCZF_11950 [Gemmataceae bacterium]